MQRLGTAIRIETAQRNALLIFIAFILFNLLFWLFTIEGATYKFGGDAESWYKPTLGLLKFGAFVDPENSAKLLTLRPPLYPLFAALMLSLSNGAMWSIVLGQLALLFATGWIARAITERLLPGYGNLMLALVIFNPNSFSTAHLFQSDTLYAFIATALIWSLFAFSASPKWPLALASGALLGLSLLVRPTLEYFLYVWPLVLLVLGMLARGMREWTKLLPMAIAAMAVAFVAIMPWMLHNQRAGEGFVLSSNYLKSAFLWDNIAHLDNYAANQGLVAASQATVGRRAHLAAEFGPGFDRLPDREKYGFFLRKGGEQFLTYPLAVYVRAFGLAWAQFFGAPGVGNIMNLLGLYEYSALANMAQRQYTNYYDPVLDALKKANPVFVFLTIGGFLFVLVVRVLAVFGLLTIVRRRLWAVLLIVGAGLIYFTIVHLFVANSRYRLPIEPLLFLLTLYGLDGWRRWWTSS